MGKNTGYRKASTCESHRQHACLYSPTMSLTSWSMSHAAARSGYSLSCPLFSIYWYFQHVCPTLAALSTLTEAGLVVLTRKSLFVCLVSRGQAEECLFARSIESTNRRGWWGEVTDGEALVSSPSSVCAHLLVEIARPPWPLLWLQDKMSGVAPHDLVLLVLWQPSRETKASINI